MTYSKQLILTLICLATSWLPAQADEVWRALYNARGQFAATDRANAVGIDPDDNLFVTGSADLGNSRLVISTVKYTPEGRRLWARTYKGAGSGDSVGNVLTTDIRGNVFVAGTVDNGTTKKDIAVLKYDAWGNLIWSRTLDGIASGDDGATAIALDPRGNVYVAGWSWGGDTKSFDLIVAKYAPYGQFFWQKRYNGPGNGADVATALTVDDSGNACVTGYSYGTVKNGMDIVTIKYATDGKVLWSMRYNGPGSDWDQSTSIATDAAGNVYVAGYSVGKSTQSDFVTLKYDPKGVLLWTRRFNGNSNSYDLANALFVDDDGNAYIAGSSSIGVTSTNYPLADLVIIKYDPLGNVVWQSSYRRSQSSYIQPNAIAVNPIGEVTITGYASNYLVSNNKDLATVKFNPFGGVEWAQFVNGGSNADNQATGLVLDSLGRACITGRLVTSYDGNGQALYDYITIKYDP